MHICNMGVVVWPRVSWRRAMRMVGFVWRGFMETWIWL
jgi:hypothetical protein